VLFDTDVLIWHLRGHKGAGEIIDRAGERAISILTRMELLQGIGNLHHLKQVKNLLKDMDFLVLPLTPNIGNRALIYIEEYGLASGIESADAIIAATAVENSIPLTSGNIRHFKSINELKLVPFKP